jgi:hypothetical protein
MSEREDDGSLLGIVALWPEGFREGFFNARRWGVTVTREAGGAKLTLYARELGGTDVVSANFYRLSAGAFARPCEMPMAKVAAFIRGFVGG